MLTSLSKILRVAQQHHFAVGAFNTSNLELSEAIISAAEELKAPVIIQTSEKAIEYAGFDEIIALIRSRGERAQVPVVFHLDHGRNLELIYKCIEGGFTSIMFDGSHLSYEENIAQTQEVVRRAHKKGVSVEAELGRVGGKEDYITAEEGLTEPGLAVDFVKQTRCDALAVGIGNNHGKPKPGEKLRLDRLAQIADVVSIPLVLHGASSTPEDDIKTAIREGITKINIDTDLRVAFATAERDFLQHNKTAYDPREILTPAMLAVKEVVKEKITLFGSKGKAHLI